MSWKLRLELMQWHRGKRQLQEVSHKVNLQEVKMNLHACNLLLAKVSKSMLGGLEWERLIHKVLPDNPWDHQDQVLKVLAEVCQFKVNLIIFLSAINND